MIIHLHSSYNSRWIELISSVRLFKFIFFVNDKSVKIMTSIVSISYDIHHIDDKGNYYAVATTPTTNTYLDELNSFSFKTTTKDEQSFITALTKPIHTFLVTHHDGKVFPRFKFNHLTHHIHTKSKTEDYEIIIYHTSPYYTAQTWITCLQSISLECKFILICGNENWTNTFNITDLTIAASWVKFQFDEKHTQDNDYDFLFKLMQRWYGQSHADSLITQATVAISDFLVSRNLNIYIPKYLVIPVYHIKRYAKAQKLLTQIFDPLFVMSLPITYQNNNYTVLFPILKGQNLKSHRS